MDKLKEDMKTTERLQMSAGIQIQVTEKKHKLKNPVPFMKSDICFEDQVRILMHVTVTTSLNKSSLSLLISESSENYEINCKYWKY